MQAEGQKEKATTGLLALLCPVTSTAVATANWEVSLSVAQSGGQMLQPRKVDIMYRKL